MRTAQSLVAAAGKQLAQPQASQLAATQPLGEVDTQTAEVVGKIFRQLQAIYPAWKQAWPDDKALTMAQRSWTRGLMAAGISSLDQVKYGIEQCRQHGSPFAPSIGQFVKWCQPTPESLGLPTAERAYQEACRSAHPSTRGSAVWSHQAVYHAAIDVGLDVLMQLSGVETWKLFSRSYEVMVSRVVEGQQLGDGVPLGIGHDSQKSLAELAEDHSLQFALRVREAQGLELTGEAARKALMAKMRRHGLGVRP